MRLLAKAALAVVIALALAAGAGIAVISSDWASQRAERELIRILEARFDATASVEHISFSIFPRLAVQAEGVAFSQSRDEHKLTFLSFKRVHAAGSLAAYLKRRIALVEIEGMQIDVTRGHQPKAPSSDRREKMPDIRIDEIRVKDGLLRILPDNPEKDPLNFQLSSVTFEDFSFERAGRYSAVLTNPKPEGLIRSTGTFGPWNTYVPRETPLAGEYEFQDADLSTIKGIGGILSSTGSFNGALGRISVTGTTSTPDFQLTLARQPINLETSFRAVVDGTSGDTYLNEVNATLGRSRIVATGFVTGTPGVKGRTISLDVRSDGRFEDFLRLTVKSEEAPMRGAISLKTKLLIPPGEADVPQRMQLDGQFRIRRGQFASDSVQQKVDELSRRGRGEPENDEVTDVLSAFGGRFRQRNGVLRLNDIEFSVKGARVSLDGDFTMAAQRLDFAGALMLDASISETTTGFKSMLLKVVDPLFRRNGVGAFIPITVTGRVSEPSFNVDKKRALLRQ